MINTAVTSHKMFFSNPQQDADDINRLAESAEAGVLECPCSGMETIVKRPYMQEISPVRKATRWRKARVHVCKTV